MIKNLTVALFLALGATTAFCGTSYKLNDAQIDNLMTSAVEVSTIELSPLSLNSDAILTGDDKTMGGYLLRSFFCGFIGLHRSYMGTGGKSVWWWYCCIPVVGGVTNLVDFWGVVFGGQKALDKFKDNSKKWVW
ncbi:MAG: hypothetical protein SFY32_15725 [Bacteroidota bacterium]|nr:hypothetical protein [Bacteroidota bacterium]